MLGWLVDLLARPAHWCGHRHRRLRAPGATSRSGEALLFRVRARSSPAVSQNGRFQVGLSTRKPEPPEPPNRRGSLTEHDAGPTAGRLAILRIREMTECQRE